MGTGVVGWQWHCGRLQRSAILRGRGSPLLLRRYIPDAESDRWQSHHWFQRICVETTEYGAPTRIKFGVFPIRSKRMSPTVTKPKLTNSGSKPSPGRLFLLDLGGGRLMST